MARYLVQVPLDSGGQAGHAMSGSIHVTPDRRRPEIFLILEMDRPVQGVLQISSWPIRNALAQMNW